jgi:hypothetical protein
MQAQNERTFRAAMVAPAASRTWEALTLLRASDVETDNIVVSFPRPALVVAVYPSVSPVLLNQGLATPTLDDLLVELSVNEETRLTNRFDVVTSPSGAARVSVTMGAFRDTTGGARLLNLLLTDKTSELVIRYRWKSNQPAQAQYNDVVLGMAFHAFFTDEDPNGFAS